MHRKLVRPSLDDLVPDRRRADSGPGGAPGPAPRADGGRRPAGGRSSPPVRTRAEEFYYVKQMNLGTPLGLVIGGGETLRGTIEWYDRDAVYFLPEHGGPRLFFKHSIRYFFKLEEE